MVAADLQLLSLGPGITAEVKTELSPLHSNCIIAVAHAHTGSSVHTNTRARTHTHTMPFFGYILVCGVGITC